ncbi:PREDICTED: uncharacterized protein C20orf24 homolog [Amphimedon queenslandica]|uniref:Rab5-interacting protein n=3 Tax=Amphimedon queenslandica TaxID=400682 RepID=A0AAN0IYT6_AMPQE|nr:PREDICTED: uncharacterized protein C20orf24 homolog [Amphimedon queenslandica]XP_019849702.1 PREDICTED: uncharacterized protein C20orf24 homolog [Amphimedon queenslandica]|eukprot:XP_003391599.1 PREDICTED: uncharacterized protein C20orf24 homolog [Amphimedon queenslandica]
METRFKKKESIWSKALKQKQEWEDKDDLLDVVYWVRQVISLIVGLMWGTIPLTGVVGIVLYLMITCGFVYFYCTFYQGVSDEELGGAWELLKEGFMTSLAIFFVSWILSFTAFQFG